VSVITPGRAAIIYNPQAGALNTEHVAEWAVQVLRQMGWDVTLAPTPGPKQVTPLAAGFANDGLDVVFAAGGDGTAGAVAEALAHTQTALGVLPIGTANIWANELGLTQHLDSAGAVKTCLDAQLAGTLRTVDLGECNGRKFLLWAGVGLDAHVISRIEPRPAIGKRLGQFYYLVSSLWAGRDFRGGPMIIQTEQGQQHGTKMIAIVANVQHYAGNDSILDVETRSDDGLFEVWSMNGETYLEGLRNLIRFKRGRHVGHPEIQRLRGHDITIEVARPTLLQFDGELYGPVTKINIQLLPHALRVLVPNLPDLKIFQATPNTD